MSISILRIDGSARKTDSTTRQLSDELIAVLNPRAVTVRDLADGIELIDEQWVGANFTPADDRTAEQKEKLALSDQLVQELKEADTIVLGLPAYNFGIPAAVKAWVDQVARAGVTFRYTETGPVGLLNDKKVYVVFASGGTPAGSDYDYATSYIKHIFAFMGITDVTVISADQLATNADATLASARQQIAAAA